MDRYQKVEKPKPESPINEYEIRITSQGLVRNYINYANTLLQERHGKEIVLKAMGQAISKAVAIAEIIKRRMPILHQDTAISSVSITDVWEPIEEGLLPVEQTRHVSVISITLSTQELNKNSAGYQAPSGVEQMKPRYNNYQPQLQQQSPRQTRAVYYAGNEDSYGQGRGRGIGRGRGWSRGGYGNYQENGGYSNRGRWGEENGGYSNRGGENGGYSNRGRGNGGYSNRGRGNGGYSNRGRGNGGYSNRGRGNGGYSNRGRGNGGYSNRGRGNGGYSNRGRGNGGYSNRGRGNGGYSNRGRGNGGYSNWGRGGVRSGWEYRDINTGSGYGGGRGYGRGRTDLRPRGGGNQA
uniref:DNA/RNA-binding protein Alba-like domain-containing protein n=1 Tax=Solanum tuberosum TaxID=4113 RepID=M0ZV44_SOLTU